MYCFLNSKEAGGNLLNFDINHWVTFSRREINIQKFVNNFKSILQKPEL